MPGRLFGFLLTVDVALVILYLGAALAGLSATASFVLVDLDAEANPSSWYSSSQLLLVGLIFLVLASALLRRTSRTSKLRPLWAVLGLGFLFLSLDEDAEVHERLSHVLARVGLRQGGTGAHWQWQWMLLYLIIAAVLVLGLRKYLLLAWREWRRETIVFAVGFFVLMLGAIGSEGVSHLFHPVGLGHNFQVAIEEGLEMVGASITALAAATILAHTIEEGEPPRAEKPPAPQEDMIDPAQYSLPLAEFGEPAREAPPLPPA